MLKADNSRAHAIVGKKGRRRWRGQTPKTAGDGERTGSGWGGGMKTREGEKTGKKKVLLSNTMATEI